MARLFYALIWVFFIYSGIFISHYTPNWFGSPKKTINFFCWGDTIEPQMLEIFEKQTGIRVNVHPFSSNEEMIVKLRAVNGNGYDVISASDYAIRLLKHENLLAPIEHDKIPNMAHISPHLLSLEFDLNNEHSLPFEWEPYVFATKEKGDLHLENLFKKIENKRIVMPADPIEAISFAAYTLYGKVDALTPDQLKAVTALLKLQKKQVEAYADHRARYLIETDNCDLALIRTSFARLIERDGIRIHYALPKDWHFINIENLAITKSSTQSEEAHQWIDFLLSYNCQKAHIDKAQSFSVREDLKSDTHIEKVFLENNNPQFFHYLSKEEEMRDLWVSVKGHSS